MKRTEEVEHSTRLLQIYTFVQCFFTHKISIQNKRIAKIYNEKPHLKIFIETKKENSKSNTNTRSSSNKTGLAYNTIYDTSTVVSRIQKTSRFHSSVKNKIDCLIYLLYYRPYGTMYLYNTNCSAEKSMDFKVSKVKSLSKDILLCEGL